MFKYNPRCAKEETDGYNGNAHQTTQKNSDMSPTQRDPLLVHIIELILLKQLQILMGETKMPQQKHIIPVIETMAPNGV